MSSDLLFMLFLIPVQKIKSLWAALENSVVGSEKGGGGQWGEIVRLTWQMCRSREFPDGGDLTRQ